MRGLLLVLLGTFVTLEVIQMIYDLGVSFKAIFWGWAGFACLVFLNCFVNWPVESFPAPEDSRYT